MLDYYLITDSTLDAYSPRSLQSSAHSPRIALPDPPRPGSNRIGQPIEEAITCNLVLEPLCELKDKQGIKNWGAVQHLAALPTALLNSSVNNQKGQMHSQPSISRTITYHRDFYPHAAHMKELKKPQLLILLPKLPD